MPLKTVEPNDAVTGLSPQPQSVELSNDTDDDEDVVSTRLYERVSKTSFAVVGAYPDGQ